MEPKLEYAELLPSIQGKSKLYLEGYLFTLGKSNKDRSRHYWRCERRADCRATAVTVQEAITGNHLVVQKGEHIHAPPVASKILAEAKAELKRRGTETEEPVSRIIEEITSNLTTETLQLMPSAAALRQQINRTRVRGQLKEPQSLQEINIEGEQSSNYAGLPFFQEDVIFPDGSRLFMFFTLENLRLLGESRTWFLDGTFRRVPDLFAQMYTIHGVVGEAKTWNTVPLVYAILSNKNRDIYEEMLRRLFANAERNGVTLQPETVAMDFEAEAIQAVRAQLPNAKVHCCLFHFGYNIWREVRELGLARKYSEEVDFSLKVRMLLALAYLKDSEEIEQGYQLFQKDLTAEAAPLARYFEEAYLLGTPCTVKEETDAEHDTPSVVIRQPPAFPPGLWCVAPFMDSGLLRGNQNVEAWHKRWDIIVGSTHIGLYRFLKRLRKEQAAQEEIVGPAQKAPKQRKKHKMTEERLTETWVKRSSIPMDEFLKGMAFHLEL